MSSPTHPTPSDVDEEYAFPSANILDYTSTLSNYFPATSGNISSDFLENSKNDEIPPVCSSFYNNPYLKDMQAFYAKESPISPPNPITPPVILTPSLTSVPTSVAEEAVNEEMEDSLERAAITATSLDAEHDRGVNTPRSEEDSLKLTELMELFTNLQQKVRIDDIDVNEDITIDSTHDEQMFDVDQDLSGEEVFVVQQDEDVIEKEVDAAQI
nr:hypothetical protein [Tanacetum cinerariifolium]